MMIVAAAIPAYEASGSIGDIVRRTRRILPHTLVVDDGSHDDTAGEAARAGAEVVVLSANCGKGAALRRAFQALLGGGVEAVVTLDADGQHLPEEVPKLLAYTGKADLVIGSRDGLFDQMGAVRRTSNRLSSLAISFVAGVRLADVQSGLRMYSRPLIEATGFPESRFDAESAVVVRAARRGLRILAVPVRLGFADGRATSHYRPIVDSLRIARAVVRARWEAV